MWNYKRLFGEKSPMLEILSKCSDKSNLRLVIYDLLDDHVECATVSPEEVNQLKLMDTVREIRDDARNGSYAILAFDLESESVYLVDSAPELNVASAILLCVVTELLNGSVRLGRDLRETPTINTRRVQTSVKRDGRGRFVKATDEQNDVGSYSSDNVEAESNAVFSGYRFRLGRH